jgi:hypothetical protein
LRVLTGIGPGDPISILRLSPLPTEALGGGTQVTCRGTVAAVSGKAWIVLASEFAGVKVLSEVHGDFSGLTCVVMSLWALNLSDARQTQKQTARLPTCS